MTDERQQVPPQDEAFTAVPVAFLRDLVLDLEHPAQPNDPLARAAEQARHRLMD